MKRLFPVLFGLALLVRPGGELSAQLWDAALPGEGDLGSIAVEFGQIMPQSELPDGAKYDSGSGFGVSLNYWAVRNFGLRATVFRGKTQGQHGPEVQSPVGFQEPTVYVYTLEAAGRMPMVSGNVAAAPYVSAGIGGKSYRWSLDRPRVGNTSFALTGSAGVDLRAASMPQYGLQIEARLVRTEYPYHGYQEAESVDTAWVSSTGPTQNDLVISVGLSVAR